MLMTHKTEPIKNDLLELDLAPLNLLQKLDRIKAEFGGLEKDGTNDYHNYNYITEAQVMHRLQELCNKYAVFIVPSCSALSREDDLTTVRMDYKIIDIEDPSTAFVVSIPGMGTGQDKGIYKGMTGSYKYFVLKMFQLSSNDDPENEAREVRPRTATSGNSRPPAVHSAPSRQHTMPASGPMANEYYPFIYTTRGIKLSKSQFLQVIQEFKQAGMKFFARKDGFDDTWRGNTDMGHRYEKMLVTGTTMTNAPQAESPTAFEDPDEIPF